MASLKFSGLDEYIAKLERLTVHSRGICKAAVWEGGKVVGDNIKSALNDIRVQDEFVPKDEMRTGIRQEEKDKIISSFGLSKMRDNNGTISTKAGFRAGSRIRAVESGTSFMRKDPIVRQAVNRSKAAAESAIKAKFEKETEQLIH